MDKIKKIINSSLFQAGMAGAVELKNIKFIVEEL